MYSNEKRVYREKFIVESISYNKETDDERTRQQVSVLKKIL